MTEHIFFFATVLGGCDGRDGATFDGFHSGEARHVTDRGDDYRFDLLVGLRLQYRRHVVGSGDDGHNPGYAPCADPHHQDDQDDPAQERNDI